MDGKESLWDGRGVGVGSKNDCDIFPFCQLLDCPLYSVLVGKDTGKEILRRG